MSNHARHARHRARRRATRGLVTGAAAVGLISTSLAGHAYASAQDPTGSPARPGAAAPDAPAAGVPATGLPAVRDDLNGAAAERLSTLEPLAALDPLAAAPAVVEPAPPIVTAPPPPPPPAVVAPVAGGYRITATYGAKGHRWSSGRHTGLDFAGATGTPVAAASAGTVVEAGRSGAYGIRVVIQHDDGTATSYSHLSQITVAGGRVEAGTVIGRLGSTGNSTGPHLHFEATVNGTFVDPRAWLAEHGVSV